MPTVGKTYLFLNFLSKTLATPSNFVTFANFVFLNSFLQVSDKNVKNSRGPGWNLIAFHSMLLQAAMDLLIT